jgi:two-component system response regulator FixJ
MAEPYQGVALVVDDHRDTRDLYVFTLTGVGFRCIQAATAAEASQRASIVRFDIVIMDLGLPRREDGVDLARRLRAQRLPSPIVAVTGHADLAPDERALFAAYVTKPVDPEDLVAVVLRVLSEADPA